MRTLREWRTERLWSVRELASAAGVTHKTLIQLEHGRQRPHYATMRRIAAALGVAPGDIFEFAAALAERGASPSGTSNGGAEQSSRPPVGPWPGHSP